MRSLLCYDYARIYCNAFHKNCRIPNSFPGCRLQLASRLLTNDMANSLFEFLPETARIDAPSMAFATYRDGWSMENLLAKTRDKAPLVMLIRTLKHSIVFGAFSPTSISPPSKFVRGNGEVFVFRLTPPSAVYRYVRYHDNIISEPYLKQTIFIL